MGLSAGVTAFLPQGSFLAPDREGTSVVSGASGANTSTEATDSQLTLGTMPRKMSGTRSFTLAAPSVIPELAEPEKIGAASSPRPPDIHGPSAFSSSTGSSKEFADIVSGCTGTRLKPGLPKLPLFGGSLASAISSMFEDENPSALRRLGSGTGLVSVESSQEGAEVQDSKLVRIGKSVVPSTGHDVALSEKSRSPSPASAGSSAGSAGAGGSPTPRPLGLQRQRGGLLGIKPCEDSSGSSGEAVGSAARSVMGKAISHTPAGRKDASLSQRGPFHRLDVGESSPSHGFAFALATSQASEDSDRGGGLTFMLASRNIVPENLDSGRLSMGMDDSVSIQADTGDLEAACLSMQAPGGSLPRPPEKGPSGPRVRRHGVFAEESADGSAERSGGALASLFTSTLANSFTGALQGASDALADTPLSHPSQPACPARPTQAAQAPSRPTAENHCPAPPDDHSDDVDLTARSKAEIASILRQVARSKRHQRRTYQRLKERRGLEDSQSRSAWSLVPPVRDATASSLDLAQGRHSSETGKSFASQQRPLEPAKARRVGAGGLQRRECHGPAQSDTLTSDATGAGDTPRVGQQERPDPVVIPKLPIGGWRAPSTAQDSGSGAGAAARLDAGLSGQAPSSRGTGRRDSASSRAGLAGGRLARSVGPSMLGSAPHTSREEAGTPASPDDDDFRIVDLESLASTPHHDVSGGLDGLGPREEGAALFHSTRASSAGPVPPRLRSEAGSFFQSLGSMSLRYRSGSLAMGAAFSMNGMIGVASQRQGDYSRASPEVSKSRWPGRPHWSHAGRPAAGEAGSRHVLAGAIPPTTNDSVEAPAAAEGLPASSLPSLSTAMSSSSMNVSLPFSAARRGTWAGPAQGGRVEGQPLPGQPAEESDEETLLRALSSASPFLRDWAPADLLASKGSAARREARGTRRTFEARGPEGSGQSGQSGQSGRGSLTAPGEPFHDPAALHDAEAERDGAPRSRPGLLRESDAAAISALPATPAVFDESDGSHDAEEPNGRSGACGEGGDSGAGSARNAGSASVLGGAGGPNDIVAVAPPGTEPPAGGEEPQGGPIGDFYYGRRESSSLCSQPMHESFLGRTLAGAPPGGVGLPLDGIDPVLPVLPERNDSPLDDVAGDFTDLLHITHGREELVYAPVPSSDIINSIGECSSFSDEDSIQ